MHFLFFKCMSYSTTFRNIRSVPRQVAVLLELFSSRTGRLFSARSGRSGRIITLGKMMNVQWPASSSMCFLWRERRPGAVQVRHNEQDALTDARCKFGLHSRSLGLRDDLTYRLAETSTLSVGPETSLAFHEVGLRFHDMRMQTAESNTFSSQDVRQVARY